MTTLPADKRPEQAEGNSRITRRVFVAAAAAAGLAVVKPAAARHGDQNSRVEIGLIGCGGRGTWIAELFNKHGGYHLVAAADYFEDSVNKFGEKFGVETSKRFATLSGYKRLLGEKLDAVVIESPAYFHPEQAAAAVDAGKHLYLAKPVAVDAPGCRTIEETGRKATTRQLVMLVDFQTRAQAFYIEAVKRVHQGALGEITFGEARYHVGRLGLRGDTAGPEGRLRNWVFDIALSGDIIVEQNIHSLDVMSWLMNKPPLRAVGACGRKNRTDVGDSNDHFALLFEYENNVGVTFTSKQYRDGGSNAGILCDLYGSKGRITTKYGGAVIIFGENHYRGGKTDQIYQEGPVNNIAAFHEQITKGKCDNPTVAPSARSNLVAVLGRTAAYKGGVVTWDELRRSEERMRPDLSGLKS